MLGHGRFSGEPDFCDGLGALLGLVGVVGAVDVEPVDVPEPLLDERDPAADVVVPDVVVPVVVAGAAAAPAIPAAAPPVARAPATIVAPSILEIFIGMNLRGGGWMMRSILRADAKRMGRRS
jgi:hypothetical protein